MKQKIFVSILTLLLAGGTLTGFSAKSAYTAEQNHLDRRN